MDKLINPIMQEINDLYEEYEQLRKIGENYFADRQSALYDEADNLFDSNVQNFTPEEMINGFKCGNDFLQKGIAGMMISEKYLHPDYIPVMKDSVEKDVWITNYLFIRTLQEHFKRDGLIDLLKKSLHSQHLQVRWHSLIAVKEENLHELENEVRELFDDPDSKLGRYAKRLAKVL